MQDFWERDGQNHGVHDCHCQNHTNLKFNKMKKKSQKESDGIYLFNTQNCSNTNFNFYINLLLVSLNML